MKEKAQFRNQDLVLTVSQSVDPAHVDLPAYDGFLDALCVERQYQKDAVRKCVRYLAGGQYQSLRQLAEENYNSNPVLQEKYVTFEKMAQQLELPDALSCSIDQATGTGKSYVMYGIARIMLAAGAADQVLVLCPSTTIEGSLLEKFRSLTKDKQLKDLLPPDSAVLNPRIIDARQSITPGSICIENIHATYKKTRSAIIDSLSGKGDRTLVLNDEVHHMISPTDAALKKWKEFLLDPRFGFRMMAGFSGTCYRGNDYFTDVIDRYSLYEAIEDGVVKKVEYVSEDTSETQGERFQKIFANHLENATVRYRKVKPLTILVTKDIAHCEAVADELMKFLAKKQKTPKSEVAKKVLVVTSSPKHQKNLSILRNVDRRDNNVEWICSVSMLTEGWDVKNVFQIVPHEERAFNSKLLIAQVLGRGLRVPDPYRGQGPIVTVFNHSNWSSRIRHLVDEILEIEHRIKSSPIHKAIDYNFKLHNVAYERDPELSEVNQQSEYSFDKGFVSLASQAKRLDQQTEYERAVTGETRTKRTRIEYEVIPLRRAVAEIHSRLKSLDLDEKTSYAKKFGPSRIEALLKVSLKRIGEKGDWISRDNLQRVYASFGVARRKSAKNVRYRISPKELRLVDTAHRPVDSMSYASLRKSGSIFYDELAMKADDEMRATLEAVEEDGNLPKKSSLRVKNSYNFKTPLGVVLSASEPERRFVRRLTEDDAAKNVDAWIKSPDSGFYSIEYSWKRGEHSRRAAFNPDFFIKKNSDIIVIEIKDDHEVDKISEENVAKRRDAVKHFDLINGLQKQAHYTFGFLSPKDYPHFFAALAEKTHSKFRSRLDAVLEK